MAESAATRSIKPQTPPTADPTPSVELSKPISKIGASLQSLEEQEAENYARCHRITSHQKEIFTAMCANINPEAMNSGAKITQAVAHILGISEVAAHAFEDRVNKIF